MPEQESIAALDRAAVLAMVSVVGGYTLDALLDWGRRDQLRKQFAERVIMNIGDIAEIDYSEQALLSNLEWGVEALEEAVRTIGEAPKITKLDHAQKMLQVCVMLDTDAATAGVQNSYISAWAHLNLAFVWKVRGDDRKVADHILEMFFLEPFCSRVDFAPEIWEHLFLPHLPSVVNWYMTQRLQIVGTGTPRKMNPGDDDASLSRSISTDSSSANDLHLNILNLSGEQTSQLQILERLYQESLDENTRQYAKYYKDWLDSDSANSNGEKLSQNPSTEPPPLVTVNPIAGDDGQAQDDASCLPASTAKSVESHKASHQIGLSATSLPRHTTPLRFQSQFKEFHNPEFVDFASPQDSLETSSQDDLDSLTTSFGTSHPETPSPMTPSRPENSPDEANRSMEAGDPSAMISAFEKLRANDSSWEPIWAMINLPRLRMPPSRHDELGPSAAVVLPEPQASHTPSTSHSSPDTRDTSSSSKKHQQDQSSSSARTTNSDHPGELVLVGAQLHGSTQSRALKLNHWQNKSESSDYQRDVQSSIRDGARRVRDSCSQKSENTSPAESRACFSVFSPVDSRFEFNIDDDSGEVLDCSEQGTGLSRRPSLRFVSRHEAKDAEDSGAALTPGFPGSMQEDDRLESGDEHVRKSMMISFSRPSSEPCEVMPRNEPTQPLRLLEYTTDKSSTETHDSDLDEMARRLARTRALHKHRRGESSGSSSSSRGISAPATPLTKPPKDFVCPITGQLFKDPVTLETGQTYDRQAIREWIYRGNTTCPITRQILRINSLPKTNYVLKRLVDNWREQHPEMAKDFGSYIFLNRDPALPLIYLNEEREMSKGARSPQQDSPCSLSSCSVENSHHGRHAHRHGRRKCATNTLGDQFGPSSSGDIDALILDLKVALTRLCASEDFAECESLILHIALMFQEARGDQKMFASLNKAGIIDGMIEVLSKSTQVMVISATLFLLSGLISRDDMMRQTVLNADPEVECLTGLLKKGFILAVVVLFELRLPVRQLILLDLLPLLVVVIKQTEGPLEGAGNGHPALHSLMMSPKSAAVMMLEQIVTSGDAATLQLSARTLLVLQAVPTLISHLDKATTMEERTSVVSLLICCLQSDGRSRHLIAQMSNLASVVELLHSGDNRARAVAITFLEDLARLNRRAQCNELLRSVKSEGRFSSMHVVLIHLQMAPVKARPVAAALLLQLNLLDEPRRRSIFRDEAVESLVEALTSSEESSQAEAATALVSLGGRFSYSGKSMMEAWLLKTAGLDKTFLAFMKDEQDSSDRVSSWQNDAAAEEQNSKVWEKRAAGALISYDEGAVIEALGQGIQSKNPAISRSCLVVAAWISHLLPVLPDTGVRQTARSCLLDHFVAVLQSSKDLNDRVLAALAIRGFLADRDGIQEVLRYVRDISAPLRHLKKSTWVAKTILKTFISHAETQLQDLWVHSEQGQLDNSSHGEVRTLARSKSRMFSGHSDGTIKVWDTRKTFPVLLEEHKQHRKPVTALTTSPNADRLYSGSLDRSIRVWAIEPEHIRPIHVFELKEAIVGLVVNGATACIVPHGTGIKVQFEETTSKSFVSHKNVKSVAMLDGKIFCGCADNSIQEVDPVAGTVDCVQHGIWSLVGKTSMHCIQVFRDHLYAAGSPIDGAACKIWRLSDHSLVGTLRTTADIRSMAVSEDFIYLGSSSGAIEVWLRERLLKVAILNAGSKVLSLMLDGDTLYSGSDDGRIRVWTTV